MRRFWSMRSRQIDFGAVVALDRLGAGAELRHRRAERPEVVDHRLVDEDVAVGEEQDALLAAGLPQPPDDLERRVGLAGAGRHDEQDAVLALCDRLDGGVDGACLVVARLLAAAVVVSSPEGRSARLRASGPSTRGSAPKASAGDGKRVERKVALDRAAGRRCGRGRRSRRRWRRTRTGC